MAKKLNIIDVKKWFLNRGSELLSEYDNSKSRIKFRCSKCGVKAEYNSFDRLKKIRSDCLCRKCSKKNIGKYNKLKFEYVYNWFLDRGSELLSEYKNNRSILKFKCSKCGTSEYSRFNSIIKSNSDCLCKECSKLKFSEVKKWFLDKKSKLLSEYKNCFSKVSFVCSKCGCVGEYHNFRRMFEINIECLCKGCSLKNRSGENNPNWNFDLTEEERNKNRGFINRWYYDWRREILRRYNNTCVITGGRGKNIVVHHLYNWKDFPEQRIFIDNGIPIKQEIHKRYHSLYGYKGNTPEQFMKFVEKYYGN